MHSIDKLGIIYTVDVLKYKKFRINALQKFYMF